MAGWLGAPPCGSHTENCWSPPSWAAAIMGPQNAQDTLGFYSTPYLDPIKKLTKSQSNGKEGAPCPLKYAKNISKLSPTQNPDTPLQPCRWLVWSTSLLFRLPKMHQVSTKSKPRRHPTKKVLPKSLPNGFMLGIRL